VLVELLSSAITNITKFLGNSSIQCDGIPYMFSQIKYYNSLNSPKNFLEERLAITESRTLKELFQKEVT
jgi:hypothetical protein